MTANGHFGAGGVTPELTELAERHAALLAALCEHMSQEAALALLAETVAYRKPMSRPLRARSRRRAGGRHG